MQPNFYTPKSPY